MRELPILFNTDMVRAILDGRKTVARKVIKPQPKMKLCYTFAGGYKKDIRKWNYPNKTAFEYWGEEYKHPDSLIKEDLKMKWNPPCHTDDILYVRETFVQAASHIFWYKADDKDFLKNCKSWKPSIHMPKEAARIWLKVTDVRVERLQDITEEQAAAEGGIDNRGFIHSPDDEYNEIHTAKEDFVSIWNSTIKKSDLDRYGWAANPWVWVIEFERCERPERRSY